MTYFAAYDHGRNDLRTFRADRVSRIKLVDDPLHDEPADFDAVAYVSASLARVPWTHNIEVLLELPLGVWRRARLPPTLAELAEVEGGTQLRMRVSSLDWMAALLARARLRLRDRATGRATRQRPRAGRPV